MRSRALTLSLIMLTLLVLTACAPGTAKWDQDHRAGFFSGIWHGWIAPVTLIWQLFEPEVRIYEVDNSGWTYDLGFYISVIAGFGGLALTRKRKK